MSKDLDLLKLTDEKFFFNASLVVKASMLKLEKEDEFLADGLKQILKELTKMRKHYVLVKKTK